MTDTPTPDKSEPGWLVDYLNRSADYFLTVLRELTAPDDPCLAIHEAALHSAARTLTLSVVNAMNVHNGHIAHEARTNEKETKA